MYPTNQMHEYRWVKVDVLAANPQVLTDYPHRYVFLVTTTTQHPYGEGPELLRPGLQEDHKFWPAQLFWAVELLEPQGWEPVAWDLNGQTVGVVMRRVAGTPYDVSPLSSYDLNPPSNQWT